MCSSPAQQNEAFYTARRVWKLKRASLLLGVGAFRPKFYGNVVILGQNVDNVRYTQVVVSK